MTSIFTKYSELDPALEARQIEAAHGGPVFDKWSFLDEARFNAQAAAALGVTLDVAASLDPRRLRDELETFVATYVPRGIKFDGASWLINNALVTVENGKLSCSVIFMSDDPAGQGSTSNAEPILWIVDPIVIYQTFLGIIGSNGNAEANQINLDIMNAAGTNLLVFNGDVTWRNYVHIIATAETNADIGSKKFKMKINGVDGTVLIGDDDNASITKYNGLPFYVGGDSFDGDFFKGNMADLWVAPGVSLLDADGNIPQATLEKFFKRGLPQNPKGFPAGAAVLLSASGSDPNNFAKNKGSGGDFDIHGTLAFAGFDPNDVVWDAGHTSSEVMITNGLTAAGPSSTGLAPSIAVANVYRSTGQFFFSVHVDLDPRNEGSLAIGLANAACDANVDNFPGINTNSVGIFDIDGSVWLNNVAIGTLLTFTQGDDVDVKIDLDTMEIAIRVNGGSWATPVSIAGLVLPVAPCVQVYNANGVTANFGKTPYAHPAPFGFSNWTKGAPDWLPDGALAIADFVNGRYYDGVSEVAATDMLATDAVDSDTFDPSFIIPGQGFTTAGTNTNFYGGRLKGNASSIAIAGCTVVVELYGLLNSVDAAGPPYTGFYVWDGNDYATFRAVFTGPSKFNVGDSSNEADDTIAGVAGANKFSATLTDAHLSGSLNGRPIVTLENPITVGPFAAATFIVYNKHVASIRSITIYPPQDDDALPALSALR